MDNIEEKYEILKEIELRGKIAYEEEIDRKRLIIEQSNSMIIALSVLIAFFGIVLPIALENINKNTAMVFIAFISIIAVLLFGFICCILVQWRFKYRVHIDGMKYYEMVEKNINKYCDMNQFIMDRIKAYRSTHNSLRKNNNRMVNLLMACHMSILISIGLIFLFTFLIFII